MATRGRARRARKGSAVRTVGRIPRGGFSLVELVMVVGILAIVAAITLPRLSRGSEGASESALDSDLGALNTAVAIYAAEHGDSYPTAASIEKQLINYTNHSGEPSPVKTAEHIYGPYLRTIPPQPVGPRKGKARIGTVDGPEIGWLYDPATGSIKANDGDGGFSSIHELP